MASKKEENNKQISLYQKDYVQSQQNSPRNSKIKTFNSSGTISTPALHPATETSLIIQDNDYEQFTRASHQVNLNKPLLMAQPSNSISSNTKIASEFSIVQTLQGGKVSQEYSIYSKITQQPLRNQKINIEQQVWSSKLYDEGGAKIAQKNQTKNQYSHNNIDYDEDNTPNEIEAPKAIFERIGLQSAGAQPMSERQTIERPNAGNFTAEPRDEIQDQKRINYNKKVVSPQKKEIIDLQTRTSANNSAQMNSSLQNNAHSSNQNHFSFKGTATEKEFLEKEDQSKDENHSYDKEIRSLVLNAQPKNENKKYSPKQNMKQIQVYKNILETEPDIQQESSNLVIGTESRSNPQRLKISNIIDLSSKIIEPFHEFQDNQININQHIKSQSQETEGTFVSQIEKYKLTEGSLQQKQPIFIKNKRSDQSRGDSLPNIKMPRDEQEGSDFLLDSRRHQLNSSREGSALVSLATGELIISRSNLSLERHEHSRSMNYYQLNKEDSDENMIQAEIIRQKGIFQKYNLLKQPGYLKNPQNFRRRSEPVQEGSQINKSFCEQNLCLSSRLDNNLNIKIISSYLPQQQTDRQSVYNQDRGKINNNVESSYLMIRRKGRGSELNDSISIRQGEKEHLTIYNGQSVITDKIREQSDENTDVGNRNHLSPMMSLTPNRLNQHVNKMAHNFSVNNAISYQTRGGLGSVLNHNNSQYSIGIGINDTIGQSMIDQRNAYAGISGLRKSSISPTRSITGALSTYITPSNKERIEQSLQERCNRTLEELHKLKKEQRAKEQEYEKKIAIQAQTIELYKEQIQEVTQREKQQRGIYEKMFQALHEGNLESLLQDQSFLPTASQGARNLPKILAEEMFNSTQMSFGREIEQIQKQVHDELQNRINELECIVKSKDNELSEQKKQVSQQSISNSYQLQSVISENQQFKLKVESLQRIIQDRDDLQKKYEDQINSLEKDLNDFQISHNQELQQIDLDTKVQLEELKKMYQINKQQVSQDKFSLPVDQSDLKQKFDDSIKKLNNLRNELQETQQIITQKDREIKKMLVTHEKEVQGYKLQQEDKTIVINELEQKVKGLLTEYTLQNKEINKLQNLVKLHDCTQILPQTNHDSDTNSCQMEIHVVDQNHQIDEQFDQFQNQPSFQQKSNFCSNNDVNLNNFEQNEEQKVQIEWEEAQLFDRLKKIIDACVKLECAGCHKLIPVVQFFDHLICYEENDKNSQAWICYDEQEYQDLFAQALKNESVFSFEAITEDKYMPRSKSEQGFNNQKINKKSNLKKYRESSQAEMQSASFYTPSHNQKIDMIQNNILNFDEKEVNILRKKYSNSLKQIKKLQDDLEQKQNHIQQLQETVKDYKFVLSHQQNNNILSNKENLLLMPEDFTYGLINKQIDLIPNLQKNNTRNRRNQAQETTLDDDSSYKDEGSLYQSEQYGHKVLESQLTDKIHNLELELDRTKLQLEKKKTQLALLEEKKTESELKLKKEKKKILEAVISLQQENQSLKNIIYQLQGEQTEYYQETNYINPEIITQQPLDQSQELTYNQSPFTGTKTFANSVERVNEYLNKNNQEQMINENPKQLFNELNQSWMTLMQNQNNIQKQNLKTMDSRTCATRMNSQQQTNSLLSSNSQAKNLEKRATCHILNERKY